MVSKIKTIMVSVSLLSIIIFSSRIGNSQTKKITIESFEPIIFENSNVNEKGYDDQYHKQKTLDILVQKKDNNIPEMAKTGESNIIIIVILAGMILISFIIKIIIIKR